MSFLHVEAISEDTVAAPGNRLANYIIVAVTNNRGRPVTGLSAGDFTIQACIVAPGGAFVQIARMQAFNEIGGVYLIDVVPVNNYTWTAGTYIFAVSVKHGLHQGLTLCSVNMN